jgi:hypothetical protein
LGGVKRRKEAEDQHDGSDTFEYLGPSEIY